MDVKHLKKIAQSIPRVDLSIKKIKKVGIAALHKPLNELAYGQVINDKLASVAHALVELRIAQLTNDNKKTQRITSTLLRDPHMSMKQLVDEVAAFDVQVAVFHDFYNHIIEEKLRTMNLEDSIDIVEHLPQLRELREITQQQKLCMQILGKQFVSIARATQDR